MTQENVKFKCLSLYFLVMKAIDERGLEVTQLSEGELMGLLFEAVALKSLSK